MDNSQLQVEFQGFFEKFEKDVAKDFAKNIELGSKRLEEWFKSFAAFLKEQDLQVALEGLRFYSLITGYRWEASDNIDKYFHEEATLLIKKYIEELIDDAKEDALKRG